MKNCVKNSGHSFILFIYEDFCGFYREQNVFLAKGFIEILIERVAKARRQ
jgi:hypothetical protein